MFPTIATRDHFESRRVSRSLPVPKRKVLFLSQENCEMRSGRFSFFVLLDSTFLDLSENYVDNIPRRISLRTLYNTYITHKYIICKEYKVHIFTFFFYIVTKMKKIQAENARNEILRYNDAYICSFDAYYGVTHTTGLGHETIKK